MRMRQWFLTVLICVSTWSGDAVSDVPEPPPINDLVLKEYTKTKSFTREEIAIMHQAGVKMALEGERQSYVVPADIAPERLVKTEVLNFAGNSMVVVPEWLAKFTQVRNLNLANTGIKSDGILFYVLVNMPKLEILDLSNNPLFVERGWRFADNLWEALSGLRHLNLANTGGRVYDYGSMVALTQLNKLDLSGARLGDELTNLGLSNLPLKRLSLANSHVTGAPLSVLPTETLEELDLSGNENITIENKYGGIFQFPNLVRLSIDDNIVLPDSLRAKLHVKRYVIHNNETVTDTQTGLMWRRCSEGQSGEKCGGNAIGYKRSDYSSNFSFVGFSDWRMPTYDELHTLVYCSNGTSPEKIILKDGCGISGQYLAPTISQGIFPNTPAEWYWSSDTVFAGDDTYGRAFNFENGDSAPWQDNKYMLKIRLVRSVR